jgi:hypothetical protein
MNSWPETTSGQLVAAWFGGTGEGHPDVGIWFARRGAHGCDSAVEVATGLLSADVPRRSQNMDEFGWEAGIRPPFATSRGELRCDWIGLTATTSREATVWLGVRDDFRNWAHPCRVRPSRASYSVDSRRPRTDHRIEDGITKSGRSRAATSSANCDGVT